MQHQVYFKMQLELKVVIERPSIFGDFETGEETELPRRITFSIICERCGAEIKMKLFLTSFNKCVFVFHFASMSFDLKKFFLRIPRESCKNRAYPQNRKSGDFDHFVITFFPLCDF